MRKIEISCEKTKWTEKNILNGLLGLFWFLQLQVHFVAIIEKNIEKRAIFLSIAFESGKSDSGPK